MNAWLEGREHLVSRHQVSAVPHQQIERIECLRAYDDIFVPTKEATFAGR
jgi:hypothetical protein